MAKPAQSARPTSSRRSTRVVSGASAVSTRSARSATLDTADVSTGLTRSTSSRRRLAAATEQPASDPEEEPEPEPEQDEKPDIASTKRKRSSRPAPEPAPEPTKRPKSSRPAPISKPISDTEKEDPPADQDLAPTRRQRKTRDLSVPRSSTRPARLSSTKSRLSQSTRERTEVIPVANDDNQTQSDSQTEHQKNQMHLDADAIQEDADDGLKFQAATEASPNRPAENHNDIAAETQDKQNDPADLEASETENLEHSIRNGLDKPDDHNLEPTGKEPHSAPDLADSHPLHGPSPTPDGQLDTQSDHQPPQDRSTPAMVQPSTPVAPRPPPLPPMKMSIESTVRAGEPRLVIHQIVLKNFKSYAGRQVIGPFHKSFSAIVGPNGSGKSNTIDALLFVFGFKATKMRQGKLSELIHNSSASPSGGFESCSVEVWFRNIIDLNGPDDYTIVPNSSLVVARTATRANQSKYTINGQLSNFKEVTTLLKAKGIDLDHKRFLILQGEVESIAQMKPKAVTEHDEGLLEYLEDIIGTNRFREPITGAVGELERLGALRAQKLERVKLVEREKRALEARKALADEYLARTNLLIQQQNMLWQFYVWTASENVGEYTGKIAEIVAEMDSNVAAHEGDIKESEKLEKELAEKEAEYKAVEAETNSFVKDLERKEREIVSLGEKTKHARGKLKKLKKSLTEDESALNAANSTIKNASLEITKLRADLEIKEASIEKDEAELYRIRDSLKDKTQVFADQIEVKQAELAPWMAQVNSKKAALELATSERDLLVKKAADVEAALAAAKETVARIEAERGTKSEQLKTLKKEQKEYHQGIRDAQNELKKMDQDDAKLRTLVDQARQKAEEAKSARSSNSSKSQVLTSLTKLKQQGRLRGFHGRLGDLGRIDSRYDVAISTACPQLDNLVCDSVETGQQCLAHLKQTNAGRAVILCLDKLAGPDNRAVETPERAPRLVDLVTPKDESFRSAFYHVLRDTVVAEDLAQANRIAFGGQRRWRVVTLDGKLIDSSGTMSGGGTRVARGLMGAAMIKHDEYTEEIVAQLEKDKVKVEERLAGHVASRAAVEEELGRLQEALPKVEMQITKLEMDLSGGVKRLEEANRTIADIRSQDNSDSTDATQIRELESQMAAIDGEMEKLKRKTGTIEEAIKTLQDKILEVGGVQLRTQQVKVKDLKASIDHLSSRLTKSEVAITKAERDAIKYNKLVNRNNEELQVVSVGLEELEARTLSITAETDLMRDGVDQARMALEEQKDRLKEIQGRRNEKLKVMNAFELKQTELGQKKEKAESSRTAEQKRVDHWRQKQAGLKLNVIENDDEVDEGVEAQKAEEALKQYGPEDFAGFDVEMTKAEVAKLEEDQERTPADLGVLQEYAQREAEFMARAADLEVTTKARDEAKQLLEDLNQQRLEEFMWGFQIISGKLKEMYQMITLGGNAELELVDSLDPFSEGIIFSVMPPKKSWKNISNLSGGEKTLSSLALVFALHAFKPTPLYFMDEIDAALDFRNVSIIGNYIKDRTKNAQFIIISLRNNMFELSSRLVGIYKTKNCTKSIAVDNSELGADSKVTAVTG